MKEFSSLIIVLILFLTVFVFGGKKPLEEVFLGDSSIDLTKIKKVIQIKPVLKEKKIKTEKQEKKEKRFKVKKYKKIYLTYPESYTKGEITLYLNNPYKYDYPSNSSRAPVCRLLNEEIKTSKNSVDFAIYGLDNQNEFVNSVKEAQKNGAKIRIVSDSRETGEITYKEMVKFKDFADIKFDNSKFIMHNKFFIPDDKFVVTGSMNMSKTGCGGYNSNSILLIRTKEIIDAYKNEFEQMYNGKFKKEKTDFSTPFVSAGDNVLISVHFPPKSEVLRNHILREIQNSKTSIRVSIFILTNGKIVDELINAHKRGVEVKVILDAVGANGRKEIVKRLREEGIKTKVENWGGKNHEKTISIDDNILIMGSANFSNSGFNNNDENVVIIKDKDFARFYNGFFDKLYNSIDDIYLEITPRAEGIESGFSCNDGIDNNFDGDIDSNDKGCKI